MRFVSRRIMSFVRESRLYDRVTLVLPLLSTIMSLFTWGVDFLNAVAVLATICMWATVLLPPRVYAKSRWWITFVHTSFFAFITPRAFHEGHTRADPTNPDINSIVLRLMLTWPGLNDFVVPFRSRVLHVARIVMVNALFTYNMRYLGLLTWRSLLTQVLVSSAICATVRTCLFKGLPLLGVDDEIIAKGRHLAGRGKAAAAAAAASGGAASGCYRPRVRVVRLGSAAKLESLDEKDKELSPDDISLEQRRQLAQALSKSLQSSGFCPVLHPSIHVFRGCVLLVSSVWVPEGQETSPSADSLNLGEIIKQGLIGSQATIRTSDATSAIPVDALSCTVSPAALPTPTSTLSPVRLELTLTMTDDAQASEAAASSLDPSRLLPLVWAYGRTVACPVLSYECVRVGPREIRLSLELSPSDVRPKTGYGGLEVRVGIKGADGHAESVLPVCVAIPVLPGALAAEACKVPECCNDLNAVVYAWHEGSLIDSHFNSPFWTEVLDALKSYVATRDLPALDQWLCSLLVSGTPPKPLADPHTPSPWTLRFGDSALEDAYLRYRQRKVVGLHRMVLAAGTLFNGVAVWQQGFATRHLAAGIFSLCSALGFPLVAKQTTGPAYFTCMAIHQVCSSILCQAPPSAWPCARAGSALGRAVYLAFSVFPLSFGPLGLMVPFGFTALSSPAMGVAYVIGIQLAGICSQGALPDILVVLFLYLAAFPYIIYRWEKADRFEFLAKRR